MTLLFMITYIPSDKTWLCNMTLHLSEKHTDESHHDICIPYRWYAQCNLGFIIRLGWCRFFSQGQSHHYLETVYSPMCITEGVTTCFANICVV